MKQKNKDNKINYSMIFFLLIAIIGLCNATTYIGYLFGLAFFAAGFYIGIDDEKIVIFSHCLTGACIMIGSQLYNVFESPLIQDNAISIYLWIGIIAILLIIATIYAVLCSNKIGFGKMNNAKYIPLSFFTLSFIFAAILSLYFEKIYSLYFFLKDYLIM